MLNPAIRFTPFSCAFLLYMPGLLITPLFSTSLSADNARRRTMGVLSGRFTVALALMLRRASR